MEELSSAEAYNLFDAFLLQQAHSLRQGEHAVTAAVQINQLHLPLPVKVQLLPLACDTLMDIV